MYLEEKVNQIKQAVTVLQHNLLECLREEEDRGNVHLHSPHNKPWLHILSFSLFVQSKCQWVANTLTCTHEPQKLECHSPSRCLVLCLSQMLNMDLEVLHHNIHTSYMSI